KFRFKPDWPNVPFRHPYHAGPIDRMPALPDHWEVIEEADDVHPFRLATSPSRNFLNSTFNETTTSRAKEGGRPEVMIHPADAAALAIQDGEEVVLGNGRGEVRLHARLFEGVRRGVVIAESIWPNHAYPDGRGINTLTGADAVAPDQNRVKRGFARDDLFVCVHEQFLTETARMADVVLPATMFLEHDDVYQAGGNQHILLGPKLIEPPGECRSNHEVVAALAERVGARHPGFAMSARELIDWTLQKSGWGTLAQLEANRWIDCQPDFETAHYLRGFNWPDGKFRFKPDWPNVPFRHPYHAGPIDRMPALPDHWEVIEEADEVHPFRLATSPSRNFLNSTFNETTTSRAKEGGRPEVMIHPADAAALAIQDGEEVVLGNGRGEVRLHARLFAGVRRGVVIAESIWPNHAYPDGRGINSLTGADAVAPYGGAAFHDNKVWIRRYPPIVGA
ncbi:MAG TPA: molybdopterin dinucleotide binding domain-containing protein, partial [Xanthobacteraceae bacterium]|nr:molybdopterin dinucleotide binding domain-containing protein [Xanthobacteraceae bacterium]